MRTLGVVIVGEMGIVRTKVAKWQERSAAVAGTVEDATENQTSVQPRQTLILFLILMSAYVSPFLYALFLLSVLCFDEVVVVVCVCIAVLCV